MTNENQRNIDGIVYVASEPESKTDQCRGCAFYGDFRECLFPDATPAKTQCSPGVRTDKRSVIWTEKKLETDVAIGVVVLMLLAVLGMAIPTIELITHLLGAK